jgi:hypothetical protein
MATLADIANQLQNNNKSQEETRDAIGLLTTTFQNYFVNLQRSRLDDLEYQRDLLNALEDLKAPTPTPRENTAQNNGDGFPFAFALPSFNSLVLPGLVALTAEITGFDEYIKALRVPYFLGLFKSGFTRVIDTFKAIATFADDVVSKFRIPDLPRISLLDANGNPVDGFKLKLPTIKFIDDAGKAITDFIDYKIKLPVISFIDDAGKAITDFIDYKIKLPALSFVDEAGAVLNNFTLKLPQLPSFSFTDAAGNPFDFKKLIPFELPEMGDTLANVKTFFVGAEEGGGILGFFKKVANFITDIPGLSTFGRLIGGPVTQAIVSIIDFFTGFYEGFTKTETVLDENGNEIQATFVDKLLAGLEGGFLGLVKGITEGFDLLFIKLPAWLLEKLGAENAAEFLRGFSLTALVDPIWNGIKGIFNFFTDPTYRSEVIAGLKEDFTNWIYSFWENIKGFFSGIFEDSPEEIEQEISDLLNKRKTAKTDEELSTFTGWSRRSAGQSQEQIDAQIEALREKLRSLRKFRQGTQGDFLNFGAGEAVILHGEEAVVPRQSNEGRILAASRSQVVADTLTELATSDRDRQRFGGGMGISNVLTDARQTTVVSSSTARINVTPDAHNTAWMMRRGVIPYGR